jgi:hypothetical protein
VVALWAQSGLALPAANSHGMQCHGQPKSANRTAGQGLSSPPAEHANSVPCCPLQPGSLPPECGDRPCCVVSGEPVRPLAFLVVSSISLAKQLSTDALAGIVPALRSGERVAQETNAAPIFVQPVTEKKTDLRI